MAEIAKQHEEAHGAEIFDLLAYVRKHAPEPATAEELAEYRQMWPLVMQMLREWEMVKGSGGCPIARRITTED